ncbi:bifunctional DedA family/phosphatase PAP2 family protein [Larsenimonas rhizosphaerae]|uniref:bifunctional DedA family/phosphatase PAP2 family protein n=1 Tax=Larsenimonas rhizosphaerae TaxID=2944682 RepID=UPI0020342BDD|nr:bifunctional DedA family/phosphatase PAP2 family protein [Larsenimonas rhizosphaerae]MCM2130842.1 bifunctional DedA family/phosphatase PAP2 family protein [Larsenimonas rhizosphaerae]
MEASTWIDPIAHSPTLLIIALGVVAALESLAVVGLAFPGVIIITAIASLAGHDNLSIVLLLVSATLGAIVGDGLSYWLGYSNRERLPRMWPFHRYPEALARGTSFFHRYGVMSVLLGRFIGPIRPFIPLVAGMCHMPSGRFFTVNIMSALLWAPAYVLPGYYLGRTWKTTLSHYQDSFGWLLLLGLVVITASWLFSFIRRHTERTGSLYRLVLQWARRAAWRRRLWLSFRMNKTAGAPPLPSLLLLIGALIGFTGWSLFIAHHPDPLPFDHRANAFFTTLESPAANAVALMLAKAGDKLGILVLMAPWMLWLVIQRYWVTLLHWFGALGGIALANIWFKHMVGRARPMTPDYLTGSFSYPSAHTSGAVVVYGLAAAFIADGVVRPQRRHWVYWAATLLIALMAWSRLMMGVHWVSDLIGGALLGLCVCAVTRISYHRFSHRPVARLPWGHLLWVTAVLMAGRIMLFPAV